jgi:hypothetical protein
MFGIFHMLCVCMTSADFAATWSAIFKAGERPSCFANGTGRHGKNVVSSKINLSGLGSSAMSRVEIPALTKEQQRVGTDNDGPLEALSIKGTT